MRRLLSLDAAAARDPRIAGGKAAGLARARAAGLPVLPGWVIPAEEAREARGAGSRALRDSGAAAACLRVAGVELDPPLLDDLDGAARDLGGSLIVRSSAESEGDPRWAGAFSTYQDVTGSDLVAAVRGCWASPFARDAVARASAMGVRPGDARVAVLLQPWVAFDLAGTARLGRDGSVSGDAGPGAVLPEGVGALVRAAHAATGHASIEWGVRGGELVLLQTRPPAERPVAASPAPRRPRTSFPRAAERVAAVAASRRGPLGDALVLPWALALGDVPVAAEVDVRDPRAALAEAREVAEDLTRQAWGTGPGRARETIRELLGPDPRRGLEALMRLRPVNPGSASRVLGLLDGIGRDLARTGRIRRPADVWRLTVEELERAPAAAGALPPPRLGPDRWEPFLFEVVRARGKSRAGTAAAPGIGAGRLRVLRSPADANDADPRDVIYTRDPVPRTAPLLWRCSGIVTASGSPGVHLFEVARSLGVPAVVGVDLALEDARSLVAVDGDTGEVAVLPEPGRRDERFAVGRRTG